MHGDRVIVRVGRVDSDGRAEGEIVRILRRAHATVVGEFRVGVKGNYVVPHDERIHSGSRFPRAWRSAAGAVADRVGVRPVEIAAVAETWTG